MIFLLFSWHWAKHGKLRRESTASPLYICHLSWLYMNFMKEASLSCPLTYWLHLLDNDISPYSFYQKPLSRCNLPLIAVTLIPTHTAGFSSGFRHVSISALSCFFSFNIVSSFSIFTFCSFLMRLRICIKGSVRPSVRRFVGLSHVISERRKTQCFLGEKIGNDTINNDTM